MGIPHPYAAECVHEPGLIRDAGWGPWFGGTIQRNGMPPFMEGCVRGPFPGRWNDGFGRRSRQGG